MQTYKYVAVNLQKEKFRGTFVAENERDLATQLAKQNLFLVSCTVYKGTSPSSFFTLGSGKIKLGQLTTFCRQFAIMINAGTSILECLNNLRGQSYDKFFKDILNMVYDDVRGGMMLSEALEKHKKQFPDFFRSMIYVGEVSGKLEMVFNNLADYYENDSRMKKKTKSAMAYPLMLMGITVGIAVAMLLFIVPTFRSSLSSLDIEVTGITKILWDMSDWFLSSWKKLLIGILVAVGLFLLIRKNKRGREILDKMKLKLPLIKNITVDTVTARFARGFGLLLSSGMDVIDALETIQVVLGNTDVLARFKKATEDVRQGTQLATAFNKYKLFPDLLIQMIAVGERANALDDVLMRSCDFFDEQVASTIAGVTSRIQPIMLGIMGGVVGMMFIGIYSPMLSIMTGLGV